MKYLLMLIMLTGCSTTHFRKVTIHDNYQYKGECARNIIKLTTPEGINPSIISVESCIEETVESNDTGYCITIRDAKHTGVLIGKKCVPANGHKFSW